MYLLNEFKRKKGSKNTKQRKDKGQKRAKRVSNAVSKEVQEAYLKSRTIRSQAHPYLEGAREARHWATLAHEVSKSKRSKSNVNSARQSIRLAKDVKGLLG